MNEGMLLGDDVFDAGMLREGYLISGGHLLAN